MDVLQCYVPNVVIARFMADPNALTQKEMNSFTAAMGFFDISGFSLLASSLRKLKRDHATKMKIDIKNDSLSMRSTATAPEELTLKLNNALDAVINVVRKYHGDVIKVRPSVEPRMNLNSVRRSLLEML